jgi:acylglycerol lipase
VAERILKVEKWTNPNGEAFRLLNWPLPEGEAKATLLIHHGHGEHGGRYESLVKGLKDLPVDIWSFDVRGHGESDGPRGDAQGLQGLAADLEMLLDVISAKTGNRKIILMGHSMGGAVVGQYATTRSVHPSVAAFIFSAPALEIHRNPVIEIKLLVGKILGKAVPQLTLATGLDANGISSVPEEVARYKADPLIHSKITAQLGVSLVGDAADVIANAQKITLPSLLYHGDADPIVNIEGTRAFAKGIATDDMRYEEFPGLMHEVHHESEADRQKVFNLICEWLEPRL